MSIVLGVLGLIIVLACFIVGFVAGLWYIVSNIHKLFKPY